MSDFNPTSAAKLNGADAPSINTRSDRDMPMGVPVRQLPVSDDLALRMANESFQSSVNYFNASHRNRMISAMARFNSEHPKESKYWSEAFKRRSRLFRPKTRSVVRAREAKAIISLFASSDVVNVRPIPDDTQAATDARIQEKLLNYRMQEDDRWYKFVGGAVQDADRQGFVIGKTYWEYEEGVQYWQREAPGMEIFGPERGVNFVTRRDRPAFQLVPVERFYFSPAADWVNVVESSPFLIEIMPMYVSDVRKHEKNPRAKLKYRHLSDGQLLSGGHMSEWNPIRIQRERNRLDRYDRGSTPTDYAVAWVHRNILKIDGEDYVFDTVGEGILLSDVTPLEQFDPRGYRPYVVGSTMFEAHNPFNYGTVNLMAQMQDEINDVANLRIDATKMASAGRTFIKRNTAIDMQALSRFSPGASVEMDNPSTDVKWDRPAPPPASSFDENNLLNLELDDLVGNFSQSSVANNQNLNETVGGMQILGTTADQLSEYDLHTLTKTFLTKVLSQVMDLEKHWETSGKLATIVGGQLAVTATQFWKALETESKVIINVGFGATNPAKRVQRMQTALQAVAQVSPMILYQSNQIELVKEIMASAGIDDITRFFPFANDQPGQKQDPKIQALQEQLQTMVMRLYPGEMHNQGWMFREQIRGQALEKVQQMKGNTALQLEHLQSENALKLKNMELQLAYVELQIEHEKNDIARAELMMNREKLSNDIAVSREQLELERETTAAVPNPPMPFQLAPTVQQQVAGLSNPPSTVPPIEPFGAEATTAGQYASKAQPAPTPQGKMENNILAQPLFVPPNELGPPPGYPGYQSVGGKYYPEGNPNEGGSPPVSNNE